ncbi:MAG: hypothetical protein INQ03_25235 [Candidatus Heimdallarchaeota archaeon]|nr:hypothetical protein [Candidatus Heimdallarchaeota archaeon]
MAHCPKCKSEEYTPIMYGYPAKESIEAAEKGELILGGCELPKKLTNASCKACGHRYMIKK